MMLGRKFYKTKLCKLYQGGRCPRANCSFAHGNFELRHAPAPFDGRRDYRSTDLRDRLDRRHSPLRRSSPIRDASAHHGFHSKRPISRDRGFSASRSQSPVKRSERRHKKNQHLDEASDDSGSFKRSEGAEDPKKNDKVSSYDDKDDLEEQLKKMQLDIEMLEDHKSQLELLLDEKVDEAHKLSIGLESLERELNREQEDCTRITSKIKKFLRAHERYLKAQDELKRSQVRLQRLGDQLGSDTLKPNAIEEDSSENFTIDGEPDSDKQRILRKDELHNNATIKKKHAYAAPSEEVQMVNSQKRKRFSSLMTRSEKLWAEGPNQTENDDKETDATKGVYIRKDVHKPLADEYKHKRGRTKGFEVRQLLPSTGMAAQVVDDRIEAIGIEEKTEAMEAIAVDVIEAKDTRATLTYMPPPPPLVTQNSYKQYEGDDEDVDVERMDSEMLDIDVNSEVEI